MLLLPIVDAYHSHRKRQLFGQQHCTKDPLPPTLVNLTLSAIVAQPSLNRVRFGWGRSLQLKLSVFSSLLLAHTRHVHHNQQMVKLRRSLKAKALLRLVRRDLKPTTKIFRVGAHDFLLDVLGLGREDNSLTVLICIIFAATCACMPRPSQLTIP